ncbi:transketolase [Geminicoccus roseus]|uniref:transketolase n=1 Tax=Geminicoccus roseus TaxID=404900 RepID=UPI000416C5EF|nr:transketolase [Geminicoccus roseus]
MSLNRGDMDQLCIDTIRTLAMDAVQQANSGHPGTPMALAPVGYQLWQNHLRFDPHDPIWPNRDRFVLSVGHASMLLYSLLHLTRTQAVDSDYNKTGNVSVSLDDIRNFRQLDSKCPGHPEYHLTSGVETTTGPLGQGVATSVGMAVAERWLATHYNRPGFELFDYKVYALAGDGDLMEGISAEAASLAGHLRLANLCWIYDSNQITIEGGTDLAFSEDVGARFAAYGWHVEHVDDANDRAALDKALAGFRARTDKPTMIVVRSVIGYGAPKKAGTASAHGEPLGAEEIKGAKKAYGWPEDAQFLVPDGVYEHFADGIGARSGKENAAWKELFDRYAEQYPDEARQITQMQRRELPEGWDKDIPSFPADAKGMAGRDASGQVQNAIAQHLPWLLGGAADLAPSTKTLLKFEGAGALEPDNPGGRNMHFGIREHAMGAACNGLALSKLRAYGATFLIFSDYMKPAIRLSALMELPAIWVFTHDSIGVGEDGPTHQPVEQLLSLRSIPGLITLRPADANEVAESWRVVAGLTHQPACLVLSRQPLPTFDRERYRPAAGVAKGAYVLADAEGGKPDVILIGTGSEVQICVAAHEALIKEGIRSRVVSMPSWELFEAQDAAYQEEVLPTAIEARVSVEQASVIGWDRYAGRRGAKIGMESFGASAPLKALLSHFGFTAEAVAQAAKDQIARTRKDR